jgi:hypothetical protein
MTDSTPTPPAPDWRELCDLHGTNLSDGDGPDTWNFTADQFAAALRDTLAATREAAPVPQAPTDEDLDDLCNEFSFYTNDDESYYSLLEMFRAVLARWGGAAVPQQVAEISDEQLLELAAGAIDGYDVIPLGKFEPESDLQLTVAAYGSELIAYGRAVWARAQAATREEGPLPAAPTLRSLLHPHYEPGDGSADGAQLVDGEWWHPIMGCDSLQGVVDNARAVLARKSGAEISDEELVGMARAAGMEVEGASGERWLWQAWEDEIVTFARAVWARAQQWATLGTEQEIETEFRLWWKDRHGSAYCGAVPLVACIEWTRHAVSRYACPAIQPVPAPQLPPEQEFPLRLYQLLEKFDAELIYNKSDDGVHAQIGEGKPLAGFMYRADLRDQLVKAGLLAAGEVQP